AVQDAVLAEPPKELVQSPLAQISAKASIAVESVDIAIPGDDPYAVRRAMDRVKLAQPGQSRIRIRSKVWVEEINLDVLCLFHTSFYLLGQKAIYQLRIAQAFRPGRLKHQSLSSRDKREQSHPRFDGESPAFGLIQTA